MCEGRREDESKWVSEWVSRGQGARIGMCNSAQSFHLWVRYSWQIRGLILLLIKKKSAFYQLKPAPAAREGAAFKLRPRLSPFNTGEAHSSRLNKAAHRESQLPILEQGHHSATYVDDLEQNGRLWRAGKAWWAVRTHTYRPPTPTDTLHIQSKTSSKISRPTMTGPNLNSQVCKPGVVQQLKVMCT